MTTKQLNKMEEQANQRIEQERQQLELIAEARQAKKLAKENAKLKARIAELEAQVKAEAPVKIEDERNISAEDLLKLVEASRMNKHDYFEHKKYLNSGDVPNKEVERILERARSRAKRVVEFLDKVSDENIARLSGEVYHILNKKKLCKKMLKMGVYERTIEEVDDLLEHMSYAREGVIL